MFQWNSSAICDSSGQNESVELTLCTLNTRPVAQILSGLADSDTFVAWNLKVNLSAT